MHRGRKAKIVATLGPASSSPERIRALFEAGVDVFRFNFSHGTPAEHQARYDIVRAVERETGRPIAVLADLQGPKLRVGTFSDNAVMLKAGEAFHLDLHTAPGDPHRVGLPHPEIFQALRRGVESLLDDGKIRLVVENCGPDSAETRVVVGGTLTDRKGVTVVGAVLPFSALTQKDERDMAFALNMGADWVALSFVQRPQDMEDISRRVQGRAKVMAKIEKPSAIDCLDEIVALSDGIMIARGDLGVEMLPEQVPAVQRRILRACRRACRPVIVATQMLESMITAPTPTRAEVSDVATAIYDGADAVMLSGETAVGRFSLEAVGIMSRTIWEVEQDPLYRITIDAAHPGYERTVAGAVCSALRRAASLLEIAAAVTYTSSGHTSLLAARERLAAPIISLTTDPGVARRMSWSGACTRFLSA
jgi:pyruvate kinase